MVLLIFLTVQIICILKMMNLEVRLVTLKKKRGRLQIHSITYREIVSLFPDLLCAMGV